MEVSVALTRFVNIEYVRNIVNNLFLRIIGLIAEGFQLELLAELGSSLKTPC